MPCVVRELGGSDLEYEVCPYGVSGHGCELKFKLPVLNDGHVTIKGLGHSRQSFLRDEMSFCRNVKDMDCFTSEAEYSKELSANDLINCLAEKHNVVVLDFNWYKAEKVRSACLPMIESVKKSRNMYQYTSGQLLMVLGGIKSAVKDMMSREISCNEYLCATTLEHIFEDSARELRCIDDGIMKLEEKQPDLYRNNNYVDCLNKRNLVSDHFNL